MLEYNNVKITWLGHASFKISNGKTLYIDPYEIKTEGKADILLLSHSHSDHLNIDDIKKVVNNNTSIVADIQCADIVKKIDVKEIIIVKPGEKINVNGTKIETIVAYNTNKINSDTNKLFHPKEDDGVGFIITIDNIKIYYAGDTDVIQEMNNIQTDIALLPVSGTYVMTAEEAAEAVRIIKPKIVVPMHYGKIVGNEKDAERFKQLVKEYDVRIMKQE